MTEPKKRIVVDAMDFGRIFHFHRILRSVTSSMQPPKLIIALLMVVAMIVFGRAWDWATQPTVEPNGLLAGQWTPREEAGAQAIMWEALEKYVAESQRPAPGKLDADDVLRRLELNYKASRREREVGRTVDGEETGGVGPDVIKQDDVEYLSYRARIERFAPRGAFGAASGAVIDCFNRTVQGVIYLRPQTTFDAWRDLFVRLPVAIWQQQRTFTIVYGLFFLLVIAIGGGALCRMSACEFAGQERLRVRDAFDFALGNWLKLLMTLLLPLLIAGGIAVFMLLLGLFVIPPWLDVLGGVLYALAIVLGFVLVFVLVGYLVGLPMLLPAVACENCDPIDAQQRSFAYLLSRPLHLVGYGFIAIVGLALGYIVVGLVAALMLNFTAGMTGTFTSNSAMTGTGGFGIFDLHVISPGDIHDTMHSSWAGALIGFWQRVVIDLVIAYVVAYIFTASTMLYLLMRRACDGQDIEEIWVPGLMPGTLAPMPRPKVELAQDEPRETDAAERVITSALRTATAVRFGRGDEEAPADEGGEDAEQSDSGEKEETQ